MGNNYYEKHKEERKAYQRKYHTEHIENRKDLCKCGEKKFIGSKRCAKCFRTSQMNRNKKNE